MVIYIILFFVAACIGMAISVYAFGTGGKRKKIFQDIYFSVEETDGVGVLYTKSGEYSAVLRMENPVQKYSANIDSYYEFSHLFTAIAQTLGEGYAIHKQDIISRKEFKNEDGDKHEFLSESYFRYFKGRVYTDSATYDDELRETILSASKEQLKATIDKNFDLVDYDILSDETENLFTYSIKNKVFSFSDVVTNQLLSTNIEKVKNLFDITSNGDSLWAYCVEFFNLSTKQKIYTFRKLLPSKVCVDEKSTKWLRAMFSTKSQKLTILKEETVNLDYQIDCIFCDEIFYVLKKAYFEQILGLHEEYKEKATEIANKMVDSGNFIGSEKLLELIETKPSIHKKLLKVEKIGSYTNLTTNDMKRMCRVCKKYNDKLPMKDGKLVVESEADIDVVLKALADYYKIGEISKKSYGTFSGKELKGTTSK